MPNTRRNVGKSDATVGENTGDSNNGFNVVIDKKSEEFKTYIISALTESVKHIIQTETHGILKGYKDELEKATSTVEMLHQHVSNLKLENSVLQDKVKAYHQKFDSRCDESEQYSWRLCLRVKNNKKSVNETSEVALESIRKLLDEANVVIPVTCIDVPTVQVKPTTQ